MSDTLTYHEFYEYVGKVEERLAKRIEKIECRLTELQEIGDRGETPTSRELREYVRRKTPEEVAEKFVATCKTEVDTSLIEEIEDLIRRDRRGET